MVAIFAFQMTIVLSATPTKLFNLKSQISIIWIPSSHLHQCCCISPTWKELWDHGNLTQHLEFAVKRHGHEGSNGTHNDKDSQSDAQSYRCPITTVLLCTAQGCTRIQETAYYYKNDLFSDILLSMNQIDERCLPASLVPGAERKNSLQLFLFSDIYVSWNNLK